MQQWMFKFWIILLLLFSSACSTIFYFPNRYYYANPEKFELKYEEHFFEQGDGFELLGWHLTTKKPNVPKKGLIVYFHGNAQNITAHFLNLAWLPEHGYDVFIFDYRGYGVSKGSPNQKGLYRDGLAALDYGYKLFEKGGYKDFIVYGQSLGGAVSMRALEDFPKRDEIDLIVLDSTFSSYQKLAFHKMKNGGIFTLFSPLAYFLVSDDHAPRKFLTQNQRPTLVIHSTEDFIVPYWAGVEIYEKLKTPHKWFWEIQGRHTEVFFIEAKRYQAQFLAFLGQAIR